MYVFMPWQREWRRVVLPPLPPERGVPAATCDVVLMYTAVVASQPASQPVCARQLSLCTHLGYFVFCEGSRRVVVNVNQNVTGVVGDDAKDDDGHAIPRPPP